MIFFGNPKQTKNIIINGSTGSGKTTLAIKIIKELAKKKPKEKEETEIEKVTTNDKINKVLHDLNKEDDERP